MAFITREGVDLDEAPLDVINKIRMPMNLQEVAKEEPCRHYIYYLLLSNKLEHLMRNFDFTNKSNLKVALLKFTSEVTNYAPLSSTTEGTIVDCKQTQRIDEAFESLKDCTLNPV